MLGSRASLLENVKVQGHEVFKGIRPRAGALLRSLAALRHPRRSLRGKLMLVVMLTTAIALTVEGAGLLLTDLREHRQAWTSDLATEASILSLATEAALAFDDRESATGNLAALRARPSIRAAALYTPDGVLYSQYTRPGERAVPMHTPRLSQGVRVMGDRAELLQTIRQNGETLG